MTTLPVDTGRFDLIQNPRILIMPEDINLAQYRCVAEPLYNSIDDFLVTLGEGTPREADGRVSLSATPSGNPRF